MARILVGIDGSEASLGAARLAARLATRLGDALVLACVVPPTSPDGALPAFLDAQRLWQEQFAYAEQLLQKCATELAQPGLSVQTQALAGHAAAALEELSREPDVELVVVGSHGLNPVERALLGSVASRLMRTCAKPVVVVPPSVWRARAAATLPAAPGRG